MRTRLASLGVLLLALALAIGAPTALAEGPNHPLLKTISGGLDQIKDACGVAVDSKGNVYVADYYQNRIRVFDAKGNSLTRIPEVEPPSASGNPLDGPCDLAVDAAGNLYVNNWHRNVVKFTPSAFPPSATTNYGVGAVIDSNHPTSVAVDPATGNVLVDDRTYVAEYESPVLAGEEPVRKIGLGTLGNGYGVAISHFSATDGWIYVADAADDTVKVYDPSVSLITPIRTIDGAGTPQAAFYLTDADVAVDPSDGHLYVTDNLQPGFEHPELAVDELSALGFYRGRLPFPQSEGGPTFEVNAIPSAVAVAAGNIFVTSGNYEDAKVLVFGPAPPLATQILSIEKTGAGSGTVARVPSGWVRCGAACKGELDQGAHLLLAATPAPHSRFVGWGASDCDPPPGERCQVTMDADKTIVAEFEPIPQQSLSVAKAGAGTGTVVSTPGGIDCGSGCEGEFDEDSTVTLTASAAEGSRLATWSGCDTEPTANTCEVTMSGARSVSAEFELVLPPAPIPSSRPAQRTLSISSTGVGGATGTVTSEPAGIDCGGVCARVFDGGIAVTLVAHPARGSSFLGWGGCDDPVGERCAVTLGGDRTIVAAFSPGDPGPLRLRRLDVSGAAAVLTVAVPAGGTLTAAGRGLRPSGALPLAAGRVSLRLRLSSAGLRALQRARSHRLAVRVVLALAPFDGGERVAATKTVTFGGGSGGR